MPTYTGKLIELGDPELGQSGKEKPRKVILKSDPNAQYGKTFRCWANSFEWGALQDFLGKPVTVEYVVQEANYTLPNGETPKPSNMITDVVLDGVQQNGDGGGESTDLRGSGSATQPSSSPAHDWTAPTPNKAGPAPKLSKDDYWARREEQDAARTLEIEAAWGVKAVLDRAGDEVMKPEDLVAKALQLIILKRQVASELAK